MDRLALVVPCYNEEAVLEISAKELKLYAASSMFCCFQRTSLYLIQLGTQSQQRW